MGIFDSLKRSVENNVRQGVRSAVGNGFKKEQKTETFTFASLPESLAEMQALPEASLDTPFKTAALGLCAFCAYAAAPEIGKQMVNFLRGLRPLLPSDEQFIRDRFMDGKTYLPFSYFAGANPDNGYTPRRAL